MTYVHFYSCNIADRNRTFLLKCIAFLSNQKDYGGLMGDLIRAGLDSGLQIKTKSFV